MHPMQEALATLRNMAAAAPACENGRGSSGCSWHKHKKRPSCHTSGGGGGAPNGKCTATHSGYFFALALLQTTSSASARLTSAAWCSWPAVAPSRCFFCSSCLRRGTVGTQGQERQHGLHG